MRDQAEFKGVADPEGRSRLWSWAEKYPEMGFFPDLDIRLLSQVTGILAKCPQPLDVGALERLSFGALRNLPRGGCQIQPVNYVFYPECW